MWNKKSLSSSCELDVINYRQIHPNKYTLSVEPGKSQDIWCTVERLKITHYFISITYEFIYFFLLCLAFVCLFKPQQAVLRVYYYQFLRSSFNPDGTQDPMWCQDLNQYWLFWPLTWYIFLYFLWKVYNMKLTFLQGFIFIHIRRKALLRIWV